MDSTPTIFRSKILELKVELQKLHLWESESPSWVDNYYETIALDQAAFIQWLQFVFIPNHLLENPTLEAKGKLLLAPQAMIYFSAEVKRGKILQLLIEIDATS